MWEAIAAVAGTVSVFVTGVGLWFVARQIKDGRRAIKAQFISGLENEVMGLYEVYTKLLPDGVWASSQVGPRSREEVSKIVPYLGFFAKIKFLIDLDAIDLPTVNRMFVFRFFLAVNNRHVQEKILYADLYEDYWSEIFALYHDWTRLRRRYNLKIPFEDTSLESYDPERYRLLIDKIENKVLPFPVELKTG
jgi:hypothetical protein